MGSVKRRWASLNIVVHLQCVEMDACLQAKELVQESDQYVSVTGKRRAMAAQPLPCQFRQGGEQVGSSPNVDFVLGQG
jgi:hypothetical protein